MMATSAVEQLARRLDRGERGEDRPEAQQSQGGDGCGCNGSRRLRRPGRRPGGQTLQVAKSDATSDQDHPRNENIPVRIGSGRQRLRGAVEQLRRASLAGNPAPDPERSGRPRAAAVAAAATPSRPSARAHHGPVGRLQRDVDAEGRENSNTPVRIHSKGGDGDVEQSNNSIALSAA